MKHLIILFIFCLVYFQLTAQILQIKGKISDVNGSELTNARIENITKRINTFSDNSGYFNIKAEKGDSIRISYIGFQNFKVAITNNHFLGIILTLKEALLSEVIVTTALGIKRNRNELSYAAEQISDQDLNKVPSVNFINNLSGKISGLQITSANTLGGSNNIILRGYKSLTQSNQALIVVDGIPFDNSFQQQSGYDLGNVASDLMPEDIESVSVLKGPAASALYGSRAANGVIAITTKKGKSISGYIGVTINEEFKYGIVDNSTLPKYQNQYGQGHGSAGYSASYPDEDGFFYYEPAIGSNGDPVKIVQTDWDLAWGPEYNSSLNVYNWDAFSPSNKNYKKATPWVAASNNKPKDLFEHPLTNNTSIYLESSDDKFKFRGGYTNSYDKGLLPNSFIKKNVFSFNANYLLNNRLTFSSSINYTDAEDKNRDSYDFRATNSIVRDFRQWWPSNVSLKEQKDDYFNTQANATWNWLGGYTTASSTNLPSAAYHNNPYWTLYENYNNSHRKRYFGNVALNYKITDDLSLLGRITEDYYTQQFESRIAVGSYQTSSYSKYLSNYQENNYDLLINFDKKILSQLHIKALLGGNIRKDHTTSTSASTNGGLVVPRYYALSNSAKTPEAPTETDIQKEVDGAFGEIALTYLNSFTIDGTLRRDKSSALASDRNTYWYPGIAGSFLFSNYLKKITWLTYGKLRANYAEVGGDAPAYSTNNTYTAGTSFDGQTAFTYTSVNNNPNLKPEKNKTYEFGVELGLFNNRIGLDLTYYHSRLIDQITPITPSTSTGYTNYYVNGGTVQNEGLEVTLNATPIKVPEFSWNIQINWSKNNNKVISLYENQSSYTIATFQNSVLLVAEKGKPYGVLRGTNYEYLNGKRLIDNDGYPEKSSNKTSDIGNTTPDWIGGINNSFTYKNWNLSFLIDARKGGDIYSLDLDYGSWAGIYASTAGKNDKGYPLRNTIANGGGLILDGVNSTGSKNEVRIDAHDINTDGSKFPFGSVNSLAAKSYVYDGSYIKLREIALSYSIPESYLRGLKSIKEIQIAISGRNLWIIHKNLPYADPEQTSASTTLSSGAKIKFNENATTGYQSGVYPNVRQFAFNLTLKF